MKGKWHFELICDSCDFKRREVNMETSHEANEHEQFTADHWVQLVQVPNEEE